MNGSFRVVITFVIFHAALSAQRPPAEDIPPAFPREGATLVLGNAWVTAWDATWIPDEPTVMHRHIYDYFGVELADSQTDAVDLDGNTRAISLTRGQGWFLAKGVTHREIGRSANPPRRAILVDLKDVPSPAYDNSTGFPLVFPSPGARKVVDNSRIVMWDQTWVPGNDGPMLFYGRNILVMFVDGGELLITPADGDPQAMRFATGQVLFLPGGRARSIRPMTNAVRAMVVELK